MTGDGQHRGGTGDPRDRSRVEPKRIVHVFELGAIGGQFRVVESLARAQSAAGLEVTVLVVLADAAAGDHPLLVSLERGGVELIRVVLPGARSYLTERRRVVDRVRALDVDVAHTHGYRADVVDAPALHGAGVATVCTFHGFTGGGFRNRLYEHLQRRFARRLDGVVAVSDPLRSLLSNCGIPAERLHVVRNGWCPTMPLLERAEARSKLGVDRFAIGWVGRISREKGPDIFVDAMRLLGAQNLEAVMIGDGPARRELLDHSRDLPVRWPGLLHRADTLFTGFDVFVLSSRTEGTPMVLLEAIEAGVPVVATAVGGVPDVVGPSEALLVPAGDPAALAAAIRNVRDDPESARRRTLAARRRVALELGSERWVDAYQGVYRSAIAYHRSHV